MNELLRFNCFHVDILVLRIIFVKKKVKQIQAIFFDKSQKMWKILNIVVIKSMTQSKPLFTNFKCLMKKGEVSSIPLENNNVNQ